MTLIRFKQVPKQNAFNYCLDRLGGVMVSVLVLSAEGRGFDPGRVKPKTLKLVYAASPLSPQHLGVRS